MSLYDDYQKETKASLGSLYEQYQTESKAKNETSLYDQFKSDMAVTPAPVEAPHDSFLSGLKNFFFKAPEEQKPQGPVGSFIEPLNPLNRKDTEMPVADRIRASGTYETIKLAKENPQLIDPQIYFARGIGFGHSPDDFYNSKAGYKKDYTFSDLPEPSTTKQRWAQQIGNILTISLASPAMESVLGSAVSKIPGGASLLEKASEASKLSPWKVGYPLSVAKAFGDGALFGLITKNKKSIAENALETGGAFAAFNAITYPIISFFQPVLKSVGSMNIQRNDFRIGNSDGVDNPVSDVLWFKNPKNPNQLLKVTRQGVQSVEAGKAGEIAQGNTPVLNKVDIEAFQKDPSLYNKLTNWLDGKYTEFKGSIDKSAEDLNFKKQDLVQQKSELETKLSEEVSSPTTIKPSIGMTPAVNDIPNGQQQSSPVIEITNKIAEIDQKLQETNSEIAKKSAEQAASQEDQINTISRDLTLAPSKAGTEEEQVSEIKKMFGESGLADKVKVINKKDGTKEVKVLTPLVSKSDIQLILDKTPEFKRSPVMTIDSDMNLSFEGETSSFKIKPEALGLKTENLKVGDTIRVNPITLKGKVKQMRVYNGDEVLASPKEAPKSSNAASKEASNPSNEASPTPKGSKTIRKIIERMNTEKSNESQEVPVDFKISERAKQIVEEFGTPIRERSISHRFLGLFKHQTKAIRVQALYDITTVTHEAIHGIDDQINFSKKLIADTGRGAPIRKQLTDIYEKLYPGGNKAHKLEKRIKEGLAVLFENYFYNPAEIKAMYPDIVKTFINPEGEYYNPLFTKLLDKMNELVDDYARMTPEQRIGSRIRTGKEVVEKDSGFSLKQRAIFEVFNRFEPLKRYAEKAGVEETWADPTIQAFNVLNKNSIAAEWIKGKNTPILMKDGNFRVEKGSVTEYLNLVKGDEKAFYTYLVARRVHETNNQIKAMENFMAENGLDLSIVNEIKKLKSIIENDDFSTQDAAAVVEKYADKFAKAEKVYDDINGSLLDVMYENDLIDKETMESYKAEKGYASFKRYIEDDLASVGTLQSSSKSRVSSLKQRKGSQLDLQSPIQSQINSIREVIGKALENRLWTKVADLANSNPEIGRRFERVEVKTAVDEDGNVSFPQEKDPNIIRVFRNGKREFYKAAPEFLAVMKSLQPGEVEAFSKILTVPSAIFTRLTTSANPLFAVGNLTVDQFSATMQTKTGYKPIVDPVKSLMDLIKSDEEMKIYQAIGGKHQTLASLYSLSPDEITHKLTGGETPVEKVVNVVDTALGVLELPSNFSELLTRYAEYARAVEKGESMSVAMYRAAEVTTPFQLRGNFLGKYGDVYIRSIPYFNATLQVIYKFGRTAFQDNPVRVGTMLAALLTASLTTAILIMKTATEEQKRLLGEQPARNFGRYIYFPSPNGKDLLKMRIPEQIGAFTGMTYLYVIGKYGGNQATFNDYLDNVMAALPQQVNFTTWDNAKGAVASLIPQVASPTIRTAFNTKTFPDVGPIVPPYVVDKAPKEQYNTYTSNVAKTIGNLLNISPILTDYWIKNQFGSVGSMLTGTKPSNPIEIQEKEFVMSGRSYTEFYDNKKLVTQQYDEIRKNNPDKYSDTDKERIKIEKGSYDKMSDALSDMRKIMQKKELPADVKSLAYEILLTIDTEKNQEDVRAKIGELKGKIADLKD